MVGESKNVNAIQLGFHKTSTFILHDILAMDLAWQESVPHTQNRLKSGWQVSAHICSEGMLIEWMSLSASHKDLFLDFTSYINQ